MRINQAEIQNFPDSQKPLVSIVLIFFNEARFIAEAIESALTQSYDRWELLLVDDGSHDESSQIAKAYARQSSKRQSFKRQSSKRQFEQQSVDLAKTAGHIRYLTHPNHENRGMSAARNLGLQQAKGDYITFLDADDIWLPNKLAEQVQILQAWPEVSLVCGRTQWWYSWTGEDKDAQRDFTPQVQLPLNQPIASPWVLMQFLRDEWTSLCDVMVRREAVSAVGGYENSFRGMYEDQAFHAKLCLRYQTWIADTCWYRYRQHAASCCGITNRSGWLASRQAYLEWLETYLAEHHPHNARVWRYVQRELWRYRAPLLFKMRSRMQRVRSIWRDSSLRKAVVFPDRSIAS